jgi:ribosomal protein S18 acetylase RimI-like enzyme
MYISLEGRLPMLTSPQVETIQPKEAEIWSQMTAEAFGKPAETEGMKLLSTHKNCDFLVWRESDGDNATGKMLGGTLLICKDKNAGIHEVSTLPEYRRKGIGAALVNRAFDIAVQKGCTYATLQASELGSYLYLQLGMEEVGSLHSWIMPREQ